MSWCPGGDKLDQDIFDAMTEFVGQLLRRGERLAENLDLPVPCMKAMLRVSEAITMKDLSQRLHCDASFVTMIADALEKRGLAMREAHPVDRRIKNLVLTNHGVEVKTTLEQAIRAQMPWALALSQEEREQLLELVRKMSSAMAATAESPAAATESGEVTLTTSVTPATLP
jgi:DNA-binding MarR family transcriptional regulator